MEKNVENLMNFIKSYYQLEDQDIRQYSPLTLAYIGDSVYDLVVRSVLVQNANAPVNRLHKKASALVKAQAQAEMMQAILPQLTAEEEAIYKRGRNAKSNSTAKNASVIDYRMATGFEALIGYLYLNNQLERALQIIKIGLDFKLEKKVKE